MPSAAGANRKLFNAAKKGDAGAVSAALAAGADVAARDGNGWIALHEACRWGRLEAVEALLAAGSDPNLAHAQNEYTPLFVTTFTPGSAAIVRALIAAGAAPSLATSFGWTAMHNAAAEGDLEALEALLAAGGDPEIAGGTDKQRTVVDNAKPEHADAVRALVKKYAKTPKQSAEAAAQIASRTRAPTQESPFEEAKPIALAKIDVKGTRTRVDDAGLDALRELANSELPAGYVDFVRTHGPGLLGGQVRVYGPRRIARERKEWHARLAKHWFWGNGPLLTQSDATQATIVADTIDGDELVFHPRAPDTLLILPRDTEEVVLASHAGLLPALARVFGRVPRKLVLEPTKDE
ncbi:MAG TPA: ankyrin repeat domain-containing protein [Kofleriaceae bacterium]|jgi:hypothetical protein